LRMGWLPEAWAPPKKTRRLREKLRRRAYLVDSSKGEVVDLPGDTAERAIERGFAEESKKEKEISPIEPGLGAGGTEEKRGGIWSEMEKSLDEEPELPARWNPSRDDVKSGEVSPEDVGDLFGAVKRMDVHRKYDTPMAVVETPEGEEATVFQQKALEDLFEEMQPGDLIAIRFSRPGEVEQRVRVPELPLRASWPGRREEALEVEARSAVP
ncbi:hypothetical protein AKJ57_06070, partial [candidate division MSBL1 archaeon SCGC-AAA259A05]